MKGYLSLGSNLGNRRENLKAALFALRQSNIIIKNISDLYETRAIEILDNQPLYLNMAVQIFSPLDPFDLLEVCQRVEASLGRQRLFFHAPRTIDIDILWLDGVTIKSSLLTIPHPRLEQRAFVIFPLAQIAPDIILPSGSPIFAVKKAVGGDEIVEVCKMHL